MKKAVVIGHMDIANGSTIGAAVKSRTLYFELVEKLGEKSVGFVDIYGWKNRKFRVLFSLIKAFFITNNIMLVISDTSGPLMRLFSFLKRINKNKVFYFVVGGDIDEVLARNPNRINNLVFVDNFFVETKKCISELNKLGINNAILFRNFKRFDQIRTQEKELGERIKLCTFSRVNEEKGISDAIKAVDEVNFLLGKEKFCLDIYGSIDENYFNLFDDIITESKACRYVGIINPEKSVNTISCYDYLLFPTRFDGEGIPGTIIDTFASGIPVIASRWKYYSEMISDGYNGVLYDYKNYDDLVDKLINLDKYTNIYKNMCINSRKSYDEYKADNIMPVLYELLL